MAISFHSLAQDCVTFRSTAAVTENTVCKVSANGTVNTCSAGEAFCGVAADSKNEQAAVIVRGFVTLPYTGSNPTLGYCTLCANGSGGVKTAEGAREYLVVQVDTAAKTVSFLL